MGHTAETERYDLSAPDAAELLGVHPATLKRWAAERKVNGWQTPGGHWRFRRSDLEALIGADPDDVAS